MSHLLAGVTLRGVADDELAALDVPIVVMASDPPNPFHAGWTVGRLLERVPQAKRIPAYPRIATTRARRPQGTVPQTLVARLH